MACRRAAHNYHQSKYGAPAAAVAKQFAGRAQAGRPALVDRSVGIVVARRGRLFLVIKLTVTRGKIAEIEAVADPARLRQLKLSVLSS